MRELTGQRVALGALVVGLDFYSFPYLLSYRQALTPSYQPEGCFLVYCVRLGTSLLDFHFVPFCHSSHSIQLIISIILQRERDTTAISTMMFLHGQTANENIRTMAVDIAHSTVIPFLFNYTRANSSGIIFQKIFYDVDYISCRDRHIMTIIVQGQGVNTTGHFDMSQAWIDEAKINLAITLTVLLLWVVAETSFGRPVIHLVS
jgi:hypothetical protein